jgi:hypothetical protein
MWSLSGGLETAEERFTLPCGARRRVRHALHQVLDEGVEFGGGGFVDGWFRSSEGA